MGHRETYKVVGSGFVASGRNAFRRGQLQATKLPVLSLWGEGHQSKMQGRAVCIFTFRNEGIPCTRNATMLLQPHWGHWQRNPGCLHQWEASANRRIRSS